MLVGGYLYDGLDRRVGKEQIDTATGDVLSRVVFMHQGTGFSASNTQ